MRRVNRAASGRGRTCHPWVRRQRSRLAPAASTAQRAADRTGAPLEGARSPPAVPVRRWRACREPGAHPQGLPAAPGACIGQRASPGGGQRYLTAQRSDNAGWCKVPWHRAGPRTRRDATAPYTSIRTRRRVVCSPCTSARRDRLTPFAFRGTHCHAFGSRRSSLSGARERYGRKNIPHTHTHTHTHTHFRPHQRHPKSTLIGVPCRAGANSTALLAVARLPGVAPARGPDAASDALADRTQRNPSKTATIP